MASMKLGSKSEIFELDGCTWLCKNELASDIIVEIGEMFFHLHKFPLLNRSGLLQKLISEHKSEDEKTCTIQLHDLPGGAKTFELVAKFCYDVKIEITAHNVVNLRCASEYLRMTEDYISGNLISHTENFLTEISNNWKDSIKALESCESNLPLAEDLHIVTRCINSLAAKSFSDPSLFGWPIKSTTKSSRNTEKGDDLWNGISTNERSNSPSGDWWYEEVSYLSLPLYKRLILAMGEKGMSPEYVAGSLMYYAKSYIPGLTRDSSFRTGMNQISPASIFAPTESDQRVLLEEVVGLLPQKKGVASTKFLLRLLRTAMILHASGTCRENLERRIGRQLEKAALEDVLIPNLGYSVETLYDIDCVQRIVDHFMMSYSALSFTAFATNAAEESNAVGENSPGRITEEEQMVCNAGSNQTPMTMVAKLADGYLAEVAPDVNLKLTKFQGLASVVPDYARQLDDGIYRAIDIYLKSHPWLTESEREQLCRLMNCQKLSLEACTHAAQNERLPLRVVVQILFFEQMRLRALISGWFFVSDGGTQESRQGMLPKFFESNEENVDEMRVCISELEKKCSSMKLEIEKLGKAKGGGWGFFGRRFGFGSKSETAVKDK